MYKPIRVIQVMGTLNLGGAENIVMNLYRAINRKQIQFDFVVHTDDHGAFDDEVRLLGGKIYHAPRYMGANHLQYVKWWKNFFSDHPEYKIIHSHIRSCASIYIPIAKKHGLKTIIHSHSTSNGKGFVSLVKKIMQFPLRYQADYLFACSREAGEWLFGKKAIKKDNLKILYNGIDCDRFRFNEENRLSIRKKYGLEENFVVGHIGRHDPPKNPLFMIEVFSEIFKQNNNARLLQVGQGEMTEQMKQKCRDLGIEQAVVFAGAHNDVEKYYSAMDVFLFPSLWEGFGIVLIEAQANGLMVICSDNIPKMAQISNHFKAISLECDKEKWAEEILQKKYVDRSSSYIDVIKNNYDISKISSGLENIYKSLVE